LRSVDSFNHLLSFLGLGHGHAPRKSVVLGLEFFKAGFGLGNLGAEFLLCLLGSSLGKSPTKLQTGAANRPYAQPS